MINRMYIIYFMIELSDFFPHHVVYEQQEIKIYHILGIKFH
uniref:Uncharacterized protein n=1 Tax=Rhizophora mucronata TaxID=61149 RepID=A0A2P2R145_RHIMU